MAQRGQRQQGAAWQDDKGKGWHGSKGQDSYHNGSTEGSTRRTVAAFLTVDFVGGANGISGGIKEGEGVLPLSPHNGCSHDSCPGVFIVLLSLYGTRIFNDGIAFDDRWRNEQDASAQLIQNTLSECWDRMKGQHDSSTEGGMGRRVASMKALNLNNFCHAAFCRAAPHSAALCHCHAAPCHATPCRCRAIPCHHCAPPCHATPCHTTRPFLLSCHCLSCCTAPLLCWLVVASPCLSLLQRLSPAGWLLNRHLSCPIATSLIAPLPLSSRCPSLVVLSLSYHATPLSLHLSCSSDLTYAPAALVYC